MKLIATDPLAWIDDELARLDDLVLRRQLADVKRIDAARLEIDGRQLVQFSSNDYLSLADDPRIAAAVAKAATREGWGSAASPLVAGHTESHRRLESALAEFKGTEAALVFASGFAANVGTLTALAGKGDTIYSDELNHASLIDGCRLARANVSIYPHGDWQTVAEMLARDRRAGRRLIVTDSIFSMDGDLAPLAELADLAEQHNCLLVVDEAHATGMFGARGSGMVEELGLEGRVHVRVGTLSKALGGVGGFVAGERRLIEWLVNRARSYVFSTALPAAACEAALAALDVVASEPERRRTVTRRAEELRDELRRDGWDVGRSASQIIPVLIGPADRAVSASRVLRERGFWVPAIREPSVAAGMARLRISLSYAHTPQMISDLVAALAVARD